MSSIYGSTPRQRGLLGAPGALPGLDWPLILLPCLFAAAGCAMLISVANGDVMRWAVPHAAKFALGFIIFLFVSLVNIRIWQRLAFPGYFAVLALLVLVPFLGTSEGGAERWLVIGGYRLQPSEMMKIALVVALAALYAEVPRKPGPRLLAHLAAFVLIGMPTLLILIQPDLGTALLLAFAGFGVLFLAGLPLFAVGIGITAAVATAVAAYFSHGTSWQLLKDYQYNRIFSFLDPSQDPLGTGYHLTQSLTAFGSGGAWGAGYMQGPQSSLDFLPEKHTDFLFAALAEEFGLVGSLGILGLYLLLILAVAGVLRRIQDPFSRLLVAGVSLTIFAYFTVNMAMVMGLLPIVGVPLPLLSHGGSAMLSVLFALGLVHSAHLHRRVARF